MPSAVGEPRPPLACESEGEARQGRTGQDKAKQGKAEEALNLQLGRASYRVRPRVGRPRGLLWTQDFKSREDVSRNSLHPGGFLRRLLSLTLRCSALKMEYFVPPFQRVMTAYMCVKGT